MRLSSFNYFAVKGIASHPVSFYRSDGRGVSARLSSRTAAAHLHVGYFSHICSNIRIAFHPCCFLLVRWRLYALCSQ